MANLQRAITADRGAISAFVAAARRVPHERWALPRATAASSDRRTLLDHPIFGRLPLAELLRFLLIHTQHHQPQLSAGTA